MDGDSLVARPLYIAFAHVEFRKNTKTFERYRVMSEDPGPAHALDVTSTREGDPWRRHGFGPKTSHKDPHFYEHDGPHAACGERVKVALPMEVDPEDPDVCKECAKLVRSGQAIRHWGDGGFNRRPIRYVDKCPESLEVDQDGRVVLYACVELNKHGGKPHRDWSGATWETGLEDFTPAPHGRV